MNGGLILCAKCGSKELLEINGSYDEHSSFLFQIVHMDLEGRTSHVPKELLFFMKKVSSLYQWCQNYILELVLKFSEAFSLSQLTST
jgi:hypothetical protein